MPTTIYLQYIYLWYLFINTISCLDLLDPWTATPRRVAKEAYFIISARSVFFKLIASIELPTAANVLLPTIQHDNEIFSRIASISLCKHLSPDEETRTSAAGAEWILKDNEIQWFLNLDLFAVYKKSLDTLSSEPRGIEPQNRRILKSFVFQFQKAGLGIPEESSSELEALGIQLEKLSSTFLQTISADEGSLLFFEMELEGVPQYFVADLERVEISGNELLRVFHNFADIQMILQHADIPQIRRQVQLANINKVLQNKAVLEEIVKDRFKIAKLLGFASFSDFLCLDQISHSKQTILRFLDDLKTKIYPLAKDELEKMLAFKNKCLNETGFPATEDFYQWDMAYYTRKYEERYYVDEMSILEYFPLEQTLNKTIGFFEKLFGLRLEQNSNSYQANYLNSFVQVFDVFENTSTVDSSEAFLGSLIFDIYPREGKFPHSGTFWLHKGYETKEGMREFSLSTIVCNFNKIASSSNALLEHHELLQLLHELGHGFMHVLSQSKTTRFQGTQIPRAYDEVPALIFERWGSSKPFLKMLSGHYLTGDDIPDVFVESLIRKQYLNKALTTYGQLPYSYFDIALHGIESQREIEHLDVGKIWTKIFRECELLSDAGVGNTGYTTFGHIVSGSEASYYGDLYSTVVAADVYSTLFGSDPENVENGLLLKEILLKNSGSQPTSELLENLLGRAPNSDVFVKELAESSRF